MASKEATHNKKVILITGASSGLGYALAQHLISDNRDHLILTARSSSAHRFKERGIEESRHLWIRDLDVIDHYQIQKVIEEVNTKLGGVDILINNAGIAERSTVEDSEDAYRQLQLDVNYLGPFAIIAKVLPKMREKGDGKIINISSASGFMAMPTMSSYSASKFALEGATESLWYEMRPWGIAVTLIVPGFIRSLGYLNTKTTLKSKEGSCNCQSAYFEHYAGMSNLIKKGMTLAKANNETIAGKICSVLRSKRPPLRKYVTLDAWLFYWARKFCPARLYHYLFYKFLPNIHRWGEDKAAQLSIQHFN